MKNTMNYFCENEQGSYTYGTPEDLYNNLTSNPLDAPQTLRSLEDFHRKMKTSNEIKHPSYVTETIRAMNYMFLSPIGLIKNKAMKITADCLKSLHVVMIQEKFPITSIPILTVDTRILLKFYPPDFMRDNVEMIVRQIIRLFMSNVYDQDGGMLYESLLIALDGNYSLWQQEVGNEFALLIMDERAEGPFHQSLLKYWVPKSLGHFKNDFLNFITNGNFPLNLKLHTLLIAKKRGITAYLESIENSCGPRRYLMSEEPQLMMEILSIANEKTLDDIFHLGEESDLVIHYLTSSYETGTHQNRSLKQFITKLFVAGHVFIGDDLYIAKLLSILHEFYDTAMTYVAGGEEVGGFLLRVIWEVASEAPNKLVNDGYNLRAPFKTDENNFYKYLQNCGWWNHNMSSSDIGKLLYNYFKTRPSRNLCELLIDKHSAVIPEHSVSEFEEIFNKYLGANNLLSIEEFKTYCRLIITTSEMTEIIACISHFKSKTSVVCLEGSLSERKLMSFALVAQFLTQIDKNYDHMVCNVLNSSIRVICQIVENRLHEGMDQTSIKILERFMIDIFSQMGRYSIVTNIEENLLYLTKIIQMCNLKRPSVEAAKAIKILSIKLDKVNTTKMAALDEAIDSLRDNTSIKLSIRKNPQTRLVIHALSVPIDSDYGLLISSLERLLDILKSKSATSVGIAYTFNCLELIVDDLQLHNYTFKYLPKLFKVCLDHFDDSDFVVRNALLQLFNVVIRRILGAKAVNGRYYSLADIYQLYKHLIKYLILYASSSQSASLNLVIQFFTEAVNRYSPFKTDEFVDDTRKLQHIFHDIFNKGKTKMQRLNAAKAYVSCLASEEVCSVLMTALSQSNVKKLKEHHFFVQYLFVRVEEIYLTPAHRNHIQNMLNVFHTQIDFCSVCSGTLDAELSLISRRVRIEFVVDIFCHLCKNKQVKHPNVRLVLLKALVSRYREYSDSKLPNKLINHIFLYILKCQDMDFDYIFQCLDFVDCLTNNSNKVIFTAEVVDLANEIEGSKNIAWLIIITFVAANEQSKMLPSYMSKLLREALNIISRNLITMRMKTILLYILKCCMAEYDVEYLIKYLFLIMFTSNIQHVCYETLYRICSKYPKNVEEALGILLNFNNFGACLSKEAYLRCLTFFQLYIAAYVLKPEEDVKFYETNIKDHSLAEKVRNLCEKQIEELRIS